MSAYRPYPKTKPSGVEWLGEVPVGWEVIALKHCFRIVGGSTPKSENEAYWDGNIPWATPADLSKLGSLRFSETQRKITKEGLASCGTTQVPASSIILSTRAPIGSLAIAETSMCTNQGCKSLVPEKSINTTLYAYLLSISSSELNIRGKGTTFLELSGDELGAFKIPLPPLPEQIQIAAFLDRECGKLDALQAKQERLIELLKEKRQALISHTVTKGLDPNAKLKPSGIEWLGDVPEHWQTGRIKTVSRFTTSGPRGWSERVGETGALFVQSGDLNDRLEIEFASTRRVDVEGNAETSRTRLRDGDVVVCITGAKTGNVAVCDRVPEEAYINQHLCLIRPNRKVASRFVGTVLKSHLGRSYFDVSQYGLKQGLSLEDVLEAPMPLPPLAEQRAIVAHLDDKCGRMDALIAKAERAITLLKERRSALISAAVTGKIDVRKN